MRLFSIPTEGETIKSEGRQERDLDMLQGHQDKELLLLTI
jgi:hypothetical protein